MHAARPVSSDRHFGGHALLLRSCAALLVLISVLVAVPGATREAAADLQHISVVTVTEISPAIPSRWVPSSTSVEPVVPAQPIYGTQRRCDIDAFSGAEYNCRDVQIIIGWRQSTTVTNPGYWTAAVPAVTSTAVDTQLVPHTHSPPVVVPPPSCQPGMTGTPPDCYPIYVPPIYNPPPPPQQCTGGDHRYGSGCHSHSFTAPCGTGTWVPHSGHNSVQQTPCVVVQPQSCPSGMTGTPPSCYPIDVPVVVNPPPQQQCSGGDHRLGSGCHSHSFTAPCGTGTWIPHGGHDSVQRTPCDDGDDTDEEDNRGTDEKEQVQTNPDDFASDRCGGGHIEEANPADPGGEPICRKLTAQELEDAEGNTRVQCIRSDPEDSSGLHTTTFLAYYPPGCPTGSVGLDSEESVVDEFWEDTWANRCDSFGLGDQWDSTTNTCSGTDQRPCFGDSWVLVGADTVGCGASQCPVPGDLGNFIAGTNGLWDEETETCGGGGGGTIPGGSDGGTDTELCADGIYRPAGTCPTTPPVTPPVTPPGTPPAEPRPGNLLACRASSTVRLSWSAVTIADPQAGYALGGWQVTWGIQGSASTTTEVLAATARSDQRTLSTSNAWTVTLTAMLESGTAGMASTSINIPSGNPADGQCPVPPLPVPTVTACRSAAGIEASWTIPSGSEVGTGWVIDVHELDSYGDVSRYLIAYSNDSSNLVPWADRSKTFSVPAGQGIRITVVGYGGGHGPEGYGEAAAQPEPGCGVPATPATPGILPDPGPTLICANTANFEGSFSGWAFSPPTNWEREHEYEAGYLHSGGSWKTATVTRLQNAQVLITGPADPGNTIDVRLRGRGRQRQRVNGTWSAWTPWGTWSGWYTHTTPTCPPLTPPVAPARPSVTCTGISNVPSDATITWASVGTDTALVEYQYEASWYFNLQDVNASVQQTVIVGPHATLSTTITVDTDDVADPSEFDEPFDLTSIRVRASTRIRASSSDPWSLWSNWSDPSGPPDMVPGPVRCVVIVAS